MRYCRTKMKIESEKGNKVFYQDNINISKILHIVVIQYHYHHHLARHAQHGS